MKETFVIGSAVADVILTLPQLPQKGMETDVISQEMKIGGCAFNTSEILRLAGVPYRLCAPIGTGIYADFVRQELARRGIPPFARAADRENGCCYCLVDGNGERTFMSYHGAEYIFTKRQLDGLPQDSADSLYFCGIEIEEKTGAEIIAFAERRKKNGFEDTIFFAPGPLVLKIPEQKMKAVFSLQPIVHLNAEEAALFTGYGRPSDAAKAISRKTHNTVIVTLGRDGACVHETPQPLFAEAVPRCGRERSYTIPGVPAPVADTIGAGDAHLGAVIAALKMGEDFPQAVTHANKIAASVVSVRGAAPPQDSCKSYFASVRRNAALKNRNPV